MSADFVWNESAAEQIRSESEATMHRQIANMQDTVSNYQSVAREQARLAEQQEHIAATAMKSETHYDSDGDSYTVQVPDWARRKIAAEMASDYRMYESALYSAVSRLNTAIIDLENAITSTNDLFYRLRDLAQSTDVSSARKIEMTREDLLEYNRVMQAVHDSFNESFPFSSSLQSLSALRELLKSAKLSVMQAAALAGMINVCAFGGDPVNLATGNFIYSMDDIEIPGRFPLVFKRFYNSISGIDDVMGVNWTHSFNIVLRDEDDCVHIAFDDGHLETHQALDGNRYAAPPERFNTLLKTEDGWSLTLASMEHYIFNQDGELQSISDLNDNTTQFTHADGLLTQVTNVCGSLHFSYDQEKHLTGVTDHTGRRVELEYEENRLIRVIQPSGAVHQ